MRAWRQFWLRDSRKKPLNSGHTRQQLSRRLTYTKGPTGSPMTDNTAGPCWPARTLIGRCQTQGYIYNEAFTWRARAIPRCHHCLSEDHTATMCQFNPNPLIMGWYQDPRQLPSPSTPMPPQSSLEGSTAQREVCRKYNYDRCFLSRCRFTHSCLECHGPHHATRCPLSSASRGRPTMGRGRGRGRQTTVYPYRYTQN